MESRALLPALVYSSICRELPNVTFHRLLRGGFRFVRRLKICFRDRCFGVFRLCLADQSYDGGIARRIFTPRHWRGNCYKRALWFPRRLPILLSTPRHRRGNCYSRKPITGSVQLSYFPYRATDAVTATALF